MEHSHTLHNFESTTSNELTQPEDDFSRGDIQRDNAILIEMTPGEFLVNQRLEYNHVIIDTNNEPLIMELNEQSPLYREEAENTAKKKVKQKSGKRNKKVKRPKHKHKKQPPSKSDLNLLGMMIPCSCSSKQLENETINIINQLIAAANVKPEYMETKLETLKDYGVQSFKRQQVIEKLIESIISTIVPKYYSNLLVMAKDNLGFFDVNSTFNKNEGVLKDRMIEIDSRTYKLTDATLGYKDIEKALKNYDDEINTLINNFRNSVKLLHEETKNLDNFIKKEVLSKVGTEDIVAHFRQVLKTSNDQDMLEFCTSPLNSLNSNGSSNESDSGNPLIHSLELKPPKKSRPNIYDDP